MFITVYPRCTRFVDREPVLASPYSIVELGIHILWASVQVQGNHLVSIDVNMHVNRLTETVLCLIRIEIFV